MVDGWLHNVYVVSLLSNLLTLGILGLLGGIWFLATRRRKVQSFFGLKGTRRLLVYVSNLQLEPGGSHGMDGVPRSYGGGAVPEYEILLIAKVQRFFDSVTPRTRQRSGRIRFLRWADLNIEIVPSPLSTDTLRFDGPLLAIGSPGYNAASQAIQDKADALVRLADDNTAVRVTNGRLISGEAVALLQRTVDAAGRITFYAAGPSARGTIGATLYLFAQWRKLARRYRSRPFYVVLRIINDDASAWEILDSSSASRWKRALS
jgi:hypothetical protein